MRQSVAPRALVRVALVLASLVRVALVLALLVRVALVRVALVLALLVRVALVRVALVLALQFGEPRRPLFERTRGNLNEGVRYSKPPSRISFLIIPPSLSFLPDTRYLSPASRDPPRYIYSPSRDTHVVPLYVSRRAYAASGRIFLVSVPRVWYYPPMGNALSLNDLPSRKKILTLKYLGYENEDVADILGVTVSNVEYHVAASIRASSDASRVDMVRETELIKLEELEASYWPLTQRTEDAEGQVVAPAIDAGKMVLSIMDRRSKLMGVDKAVPQEVNHTHSLVTILAGIARDAENMVTING